MEIKLNKILKQSVILGFSQNKIVIFDRMKKQTYCIVDLNFNNNIWENQSLIGKVVFIDDLMLFTPNDNSIFVNSDTGTIIDTIFLHYVNHSNEILLGVKSIDSNFYSIAFNYKTKMFLWEKNLMMSSLNCIRKDYSFLVFLNKSYNFENIINCVNIYSGNILWQFSLKDFPNYINGFCREQEADIKQIIGVYNNFLWVHVGGFRLIGIDIETGKLVHYIEDMPYALGLTKEERYHFDFSPFGGYSIHLDETQGVLKAFAHRYYIEIDLNTLKGLVKKDFGEDWKKSWRIKNSVYYHEYPDLLFFSGNYQNINNPNAFGIFDTEKAEIIWYDTTKDDLGYFYNPPQANDKLLAVLDDKHNLLVYERD
jgi:hypothetical protein